MESRELSLKNNFLKYAPYLFLGVSILLFYFKIVTGQGAWLVSDHAEQHFPWAAHLAEKLKSGSWPIWTSMMHSGFPITAEGQNGAFYLPNLLFYRFLPFQLGYAWNIIFHFLLSAGFMYAFVRRLGLGALSSLLGTFAYLYGSTLGGAFYNITSLKVLTWFPATLLLCEAILSSPKIKKRQILLMGVLFALQLLVGYLQYAVYSILFTGIYAVFRSWDFSHLRNLRTFIKIVFVMGLSAIIAGILAFPQLHMTYELAILSNRGSADEAFAFVGSYSPFAISCMIFPNLESLFASKIYQGILPLFFVVVAAFFFKREETKSVYWIVILALLLALGAWSPLYVFIIKVTQFYSFRTPMKFIYFLGFFLCILCSIGVERALKQENLEKVAKAFKVYSGIMLLFFLGTLVSFLIFKFFRQSLFDLGEWMVQKWIYSKPGHPFSWDHYVNKLNHYIDYATTMLNPLSYSIWIPAIKTIAACGLVAFFVAKKLKAKVFYVLAFVVIIVDLNFTYADIQGDYASYKDYFKPSTTVDFFQQNMDKERYFLYSDVGSNSPLPVAKNMVYGIHTVNAYSPLVTKDYYDFFIPFGGVNDSTGVVHGSDEGFYRSLALLGMLNVKYVLSEKDLENPNLTLVHQEGQWKTYENKTVLDRYRLLSSYKALPRSEILGALRQPQYNPSEIVYLEEQPTIFYGEAGESIRNDVEILSEAEERIELRVRTTEPQLLVIAQIYFPGWRVYVNGEEVETYRANYILTAVPIQAGVHEVVLSYHPLKQIFDRKK